MKRPAHKTTGTTGTTATTAPRRAFLKRAAIAGAAIGAGTGATRALADAGDSQVAPAKNAGAGTGAAPKRGYRETAHVREYYKLARF